MRIKIVTEGSGLQLRIDDVGLEIVVTGESLGECVSAGVRRFAELQQTFLTELERTGIVRSAASEGLS